MEALELPPALASLQVKQEGVPNLRVTAHMVFSRTKWALYHSGKTSARAGTRLAALSPACCPLFGMLGI